jgi:hypothetical protein
MPKGPVTQDFPLFPQAVGWVGESPSVYPVTGHPPIGEWCLTSGDEWLSCLYEVACRPCLVGWMERAAADAASVLRVRKMVRRKIGPPIALLRRGWRVSKEEA